MMHDDGQLPADLETADVILVGISRTSKTPTSIYLANRGIKTANIPLVPGDAAAAAARDGARSRSIVGLVASPERIVQIRQNRLLALQRRRRHAPMSTATAVAEEVAYSRKLCARHGWPMIDVTRRSIEETAAAIIDLYKRHACSSSWNDDAACCALWLESRWSSPRGAPAACRAAAAAGIPVEARPAPRSTSVPWKRPPG